MPMSFLKVPGASLVATTNVLVPQRRDLASTTRSATATSLARAAIAGPIIFTIAWMALGLLRPGYSFISQPISVLGVGPNAALMNGAFVVMGLLMMVGVVGIFQSIRELGTAARCACTLLLGVSGLGAIMCGVFTYKAAPFPHFLGLVLGFLSTVVGLLVTGITLRRVPRWRRFGGFLILASPLTFALMYVNGATFNLSMVEAGVGVAGLTERIAVIELHWWYVALAWLATRRNAPKAYKGPAMEGFIATWYAKNTKGDARGYRDCAKSVAERVPAGGSVLEVAAGPGYLAIELAKLGRHVFGMDISKSFVRIAAENARAAGVVIEFREGNASELPYEDESFDFVVCRAAFKNFTDPARALSDIHRVLKPGGQASIFDLRRDASHEEIKALVESLNLPRLSSWWTTLTFRFFLLKNAYTKAAIERLAAASPFGGCNVRQSGVEFDLRLAKTGSQSAASHGDAEGRS
jgi:ubiquinone/menaquinone biosynthesis C-methylase UbiE/hypothetical membrane protein